MKLQAKIWYLEGRLEEAKFEALGALDVCMKLEASRDAEDHREFLQQVKKAMNGEFLETVILYAHSPSIHSSGCQGKCKLTRWFKYTLPILPSHLNGLGTGPYRDTNS